MSDRLRHAFEEASKLPEDEQDAFASFLLAELKDELQGQRRLAQSQDALAKFADEARAEHAAGPEPKNSH